MAFDENDDKIFEEDENFSAAVKDFSKLIELNFEDVAEWYVKRGENFFELREFLKALADFEKAVELNYKHKSSTKKDVLKSKNFCS